MAPHLAARIEQSIDALPAGEAVAVVGGEPTLHDTLFDWVARVRARGAPDVLLQTNGRRLAVAPYAERLVEAGVSGLDVSLHGATEAMHDYHTSVPGSFRQTVAGLRRARAAGLPFATTSVVTRSSFRHLSEIVRVAQALGARAVHFAIAERFGRAAPGAVVPAREMVRPHLRRALELARALGLETLVGDVASRGVAREWFAGIGAVEPVEPSSPTLSKVHLSVSPLERPRSVAFAELRPSGAPGS